MMETPLRELLAEIQESGRAHDERAAANLQRAGLRDAVDLKHADATEIVRSLEGAFDFVFFDSAQVRPAGAILPPGADWVGPRRRDGWSFEFFESRRENMADTFEPELFPKRGMASRSESPAGIDVRGFSLSRQSSGQDYAP